MELVWDHLRYKIGDKIVSNLSFNDEQIRLLRDGLKPAQRIADICLGFGNLASALVLEGKTVYGVDINPRSVAYARMKIGSGVKGKFYGIEAKAQQMPFRDGTMDGACCASSLGLFYDLDPLMSELGRVVKPSGIVAVTGYISANGPRWIENAQRELVNKATAGKLYFRQEAKLCAF